MGLTLYTGGTFDLFHPGHVDLLRQCRQLSGVDGKVIVSLNTDEFVREYKRIIPTFTFAERKAILESCRYVDLVVKNIGGKDSKPSIEAVMPNIIAIGEDWKSRDYHAQMGFTPEWLKERHIEIWYIKHLTGYSSTNVRKSLAAVP